MLETLLDPNQQVIWIGPITGDHHPKVAGTIVALSDYMFEASIALILEDINSSYTAIRSRFIGDDAARVSRGIRIRKFDELVVNLVSRSDAGSHVLAWAILNRHSTIDSGGWAVYWRFAVGDGWFPFYVRPVVHWRFHLSGIIWYRNTVRHWIPSSRPIMNVYVDNTTSEGEQ